MPWYRISINHGPGHQSHTVKYEWCDVKLKTDKEKNDFAENFIEPHWDWPVGNIVEVKRLPEKIKQRKIRENEEEIMAATEMLKALSKTKIERKVREVKFLGDRATKKDLPYAYANSFIQPKDGKLLYKKFVIMIKVDDGDGVYNYIPITNKIEDKLIKLGLETSANYYPDNVISTINWLIDNKVF